MAYFENKRKDRSSIINIECLVNKLKASWEWVVSKCSLIIWLVIWLLIWFFYDLSSPVLKYIPSIITSKPALIVIAFVTWIVLTSIYFNNEYASKKSKSSLSETDAFKEQQSFIDVATTYFVLPLFMVGTNLLTLSGLSTDTSNWFMPNAAALSMLFGIFIARTLSKDWKERNPLVTILTITWILTIIILIVYMLSQLSIYLSSSLKK